MADKQSVAAQLQRQATQNMVAQEAIDRDPEEAASKLAPGVNGELTLQDVFGLFMQLSKQQAALQEQLVGLLTHQQKQEARQVHVSKEEMENSRLRRERTLDAWKHEPLDHVWIEPDLDEQKLAQSHNGEMPPRMFRINGIEFPVKVGEVVEVPMSVAELIRHTQRKRPMARGPQQIPAITDPGRGQFLAGSQEVSAGYPGATGKGPVLATAGAATPDQAQPLDVRYDSWGR